MQTFSAVSNRRVYFRRIRHSLVFASSLIVALALTACRIQPQEGAATSASGGKLSITTTTNLVADLASVVGGQRVQVQSLMGAGIDPHVYKVSEGDLAKLRNAQIVFYSGLHLEGRMTDVLEKMPPPALAVAVTKNIDPAQLKTDGTNAGHDPHVWFDPELWLNCARTVRDTLVAKDPAGKPEFDANYTRFETDVRKTSGELKALMLTVPEQQRLLITAHDAFQYFSRAFAIEVHGLQGINTAAEASARDVDRLVSLIVDRKVRAVFIETSVSAKTIEAVQSAVRSKGHQVAMGGSLYSDALDAPDKAEGSYLGMLRHNVETIVKGLAPGKP